MKNRKSSDNDVQVLHMVCTVLISLLPLFECKIVMIQCVCVCVCVRVCVYEFMYERMYICIGIIIILCRVVSLCRGRRCWSACWHNNINYTKFLPWRRISTSSCSSSPSISKLSL